MPAKIPYVHNTTAQKLALLGQQIRLQRKILRISATAAAEAAGLSRVTLHRIEKGASSVAMAAYLNVMTALGLDFDIFTPKTREAKECDQRKGWIPARIRLGDYPQLELLAWQMHGTKDLSPSEALGVYERNWRHLDFDNMQPREQDLIEALQVAFGTISKHDKDV